MYHPKLGKLWWVNLMVFYTGQVEQYRGLQRLVGYFHMWWECPVIQVLWGILQQVSAIVQLFSMHPGLALLSILPDTMWNVQYKEWIVFLLVTALTEAAQHWTYHRHFISLRGCWSRICRLAVTEKLRERNRQAREAKMQKSSPTTCNTSHCLC